ncbi:MAG: Ku protein [Dehalococcoidia bacterium]|nr:Ku protein [Dehalococcoidia bacterium]
MARSFWKGAISFGLVAIPVRMSLATESRTPGFHLLHRKCLTRPKQVLYCPKDAEYFGLKDTSRGYEYTKDQYVVFEENEFERIPVKTMHTIDIRGFVEPKEIDPIYFRGSHYLEPEELGVKPYCLLRDALVKTKRVAVAKVAFQRREHLCCLRPLGQILVLHTMYYPDEIVPRDELAPARPEVTPAEMELATKLVSTLAVGFSPEQYKDEYTETLRKIVEAKVQGQEIEAAPAPAEAVVEDLMSALRSSIEEARRASAAKK